MHKNYFFKLTSMAFATFLLLAACQPKTPPTNLWELDQTITLPGINPIGLAVVGDTFWLSDGDHNRVIALSEKAVELDRINGLDRPMRLAADAGVLWIPQYGSDTILQHHIQTKNQTPLLLSETLDAPAAVALFKNEKAIADFYNHRILYFNGVDWISFGEQGKAAGAFYYPTDVQITAHYIWVADAYNNRVQVFNKQGNFVRMIGEDQKMNAATGLFVSEDQVFVTDFENHRVLVFFHDGQLAQEISEGLEKPIDALVKEGALFIIDYKTSLMKRYYFND